MPRQYKRKSLRATSYTQEDLLSAVQRVKNNELSNYAASRIYGIPSSTLNDHVKEKSGLVSQTLGRATAIPIEMENKLASCIRTLEKWGWGLSRTEILDITAEFVKSNKLKTPFKDDRPGPDWFISFRKRHNLSIKKPQSIEYLRKRMTDPFVIDEYFTLLKETLSELGINEPERIWNLDETSVCLDPTKTKIVGNKGVPATRTTKGTGKENVTVLTTVSAAGAKLSPLIVFKGKNVYHEWMSNTQKGEYDFELSYAASKRGWMETDIFFNYMDKIVVPKLADGRPVLIIYDGHSTHVDAKVVALAVKHNITILKLPAHTSHLLQPLDLAVFKSFKTNWDKKLVLWQRQNVGLSLRKQVFAEMFAEAWHEVNINVIRNGFRKGGIYPYNDKVITEEKYDPEALKRWKAYISEKKLTGVKTLKNTCVEVMNKNMFGHTSAPKEDFTERARQSRLGYNISFEELILQKVTQNTQNSGNKKSAKLTRAAKGSEVITRTYLENLKEKEIQCTQSTKTILNKTLVSEAGPSNVPKKFKTKNATSIPQFNKNAGQSNISQKESKKYIPISKKGKRIVNKSRSINKITIVKCEPEKNKKKTLKSNKTNKIRPANKIKRSISVNTTPESGEVSTHSDSDIIDTISDNFSELDIEEDSYDAKKPDQKFFTPPKSNQQVFRKGELQKNDEMKELQVSHDIIEELQKNDRVKELQIENYQDIVHINTMPIEEIKNFKIEMNTNPQDKLENLALKREKVTILSSVRLKPENTAFIGKCAFLEAYKIEKSFDLIRHNKRQCTQDNFTDKENRPAKIPKRLNDYMTNENNVNESFETDANEKDKNAQKDREKSVKKIKKEKCDKNMHEQKLRTETSTYNIGDTVLVRYHTKSWKYYVGVIEQINLETKRILVCYYKTIGKKDNVKFIVPKRKDQDWVPEILIVKQIELLQINENPVEFTLMNDEVDAIYF